MILALKINISALIICKAISFKIGLVHPISMLLFIVFWLSYLLLLFFSPSKKITQAASFICLIFFANASIFVFGLSKIEPMFLIELILITSVFFLSVFASKHIQRAD
jgi:hypothetical protein